jgi:hypothetical protein
MRRRTLAELNYQVMNTLVLKVRALSILIILYLTRELVIGTDLSPIQPRLLVLSISSHIFSMSGNR